MREPAGASDRISLPSSFSALRSRTVLVLFVLLLSVSEFLSASGSEYFEAKTATYVLGFKRHVEWGKCEVTRSQRQKLFAELPDESTSDDHFPEIPCRKIEWLGGAYAVGLNPVPSTMFGSPSGDREWVRLGDTISTERLRLLGYSGDRLLVDGGCGEHNCLILAMIPPPELPIHWQTCEERMEDRPRESTAPPAGEVKAGNRSCSQLAVASIGASKEGSPEAAYKNFSATLMDRERGVWTVHIGDRICREALRIRLIDFGLIVTEPDAKGNNCFRPQAEME